MFLYEAIKVVAIIATYFFVHGNNFSTCELIERTPVVSFSSDKEFSKERSANSSADVLCRSISFDGKPKPPFLFLPNQVIMLHFYLPLLSRWPGRVKCMHLCFISVA
jgi:hypothetical protein